MPRTGRPGLLKIEKEALWEKWRKGESFSDIATALGKAPGSVFGVLRLQGGIYKPPPSRSKRSLNVMALLPLPADITHRVLPVSEHPLLGDAVKASQI